MPPLTIPPSLINQDPAPIPAGRNIQRLMEPLKAVSPKQRAFDEALQNFRIREMLIKMRTQEPTEFDEMFGPKLEKLRGFGFPFTDDPSFNAPANRHGPFNPTMITELLQSLNANRAQA